MELDLGIEVGVELVEDEVVVGIELVEDEVVEGLELVEDEVVEGLDDQLFKFNQVIQDLNYEKFLCLSYLFDLKQRIKRVKHNT